MHDRELTLLLSLLLFQENINETNIVEVIGKLEELVGNTISHDDQSARNFKIIVNIVDISSRIVNGTTFGAMKVTEVGHNNSRTYSLLLGGC